MSESSGEKIEWRGSISQWHYFGRWVLVLLLLAGAVGTFFYEPARDWPHVWIARAVLAGLALLLAIWIHFDRSQRRYTVTSARVIVEYGLVSRRSNEIRIQDVRSINLTRSGFSGLLGIGRVEFASAADDDAEVVFWNTPDAEKIRDLVRTIQGHTTLPTA